MINHLVELRKRFLFIALGIVLCLVILLPFCNEIYQIVAIPIGKYLPQNTQLIATDIISPFFVPVKLTTMVAIFFSIPNTIYQIWQFIAPGLYQREKLLLFSITTSSVILFAIGVAFCYYLVLPAIFHFIANFKMTQITMMTDIDKYLSFVLSMFLIFGIAFETPVLVFILIYTKILPIEIARKIRKYVFVGCFVIAAIVTPPDVFSQTMLALPLYVLYEVGLIMSRFINKKSILKPL